ncbi:MAG: rRNA pseudouridine synthase [Lachnospiraceae bacterium]|nr:rRNA pseudouridine synthase [Lachnospiraceae bacterium]
MSIIRLDKYLADSGIGTRSEVKKIIRTGTVTINGITVTVPETKIHTDEDRIVCRGQLINRQDLVYYILNKPAGYISATDDPDQPTVLDLIKDPFHKDLFPVGRLDKDTEGLLLITNDGELAHELLSPKKHVDKLYYVETDSAIPTQAVQIFREGIDIGDDSKTLPAKLLLLSPTSAHIIIREGRYHQIKRMLRTVGCEVVYLKRLQMGSLILPPDLESGKYRPLTEQELTELIPGRSIF